MLYVLVFRSAGSDSNVTTFYADNDAHAETCARELLPAGSATRYVARVIAN